MLHTKYHGSKPYGFKQDFFHAFPYIGLCKHVTPGAGHFWPLGYNLNKLRRGSLGDALGLVVLDKKIFSCFSLY